MTYSETLDYLFNSLPMFQRLGRVAYKSDLDTTLELDRHFKHPHRNFRSMHVAGTNGKGSVSHMLASVLQETGYKTGLYTSPHLKDFRERIRVNGVPICENEVVRFVAENRELFERIKPSFFEMTVALAFQHFEKERVDVAVVEVGMGGRLDSTNILDPILTVITNIGHDHMEYLGSGLAEIAGEKAGIIKKKVPVVIGESGKETDAVFTERATEKGSDLFFADRIFSIPFSFQTPEGKQSLNVYRKGDLVYKEMIIDLLGLYQRKNVVTALMSLERLGKAGFTIPVDRIYAGLANVTSNTGLSGRWQVLGHQPLVICDSGHNLEGIKSVVSQIHQTPHKKLWMVFGMVSDKTPDPIFEVLPGDATWFFTQAQIPRAMDAHLLAEKAAKKGLKGEVIPSVREAVARARSLAGPDDLVFIGGSTFVVAEVV